MEKKYEHLSCEAAVQQQWNAEKTYTAANNPGPLFSIDTPPPTVSGKLHIGHIFSYTQTDIIARYKRMTGRSVFYPFGFDDNGLPTERYVEKKLAIKGHELPRSEFIALCIKESLEAAEQFKALWQKMGLSADWDLVYSTISDSSRAISQKSFIELFKKNYIYRKQEPALYCATCRTSVAQAELDDKETPSLFNDITFKDSDGNDLTIATTRPELLPACAAILFNPHDVRYQKLRGKKALVPLFGHTVPLIEDDLVEIDKGSGLVMVCTFGDKTDIIWYKKHNLPYKQVIGFDGKCTENAGFLQGLKVADARTAVLEKLKENGLLTNQKPISHSVNVHERCKKEIEFVIIPQWFISILPYKQNFLEIADTINWYPAFMKSRYIDWVENLAWDWGISRQRFYGIPFPAWHCKDCSAILLAQENQLPIDPQETAYGKPCDHCGSSNIVPDTDVMDTWNTSSLTPYICEELYKKSSTQTNESFLPMSMRPQAHDIIRTWAFDTIVKTWMHDQTAPWKDIIISGHVLSDKKEKISKKEGNGMEPEQLLAKYPADAIRYWTASAKLGQDISFSDEQLMIGQKLITKLWNAFKFAEPHLLEFNTPHTFPETIGAVNEWLLHTISACFTKYQSYLEQQEPGLALNTIEQFFWSDYCDNYIELVKNQLFNPQDYPADQIYATRWTLYHVGLRILQLYAPYLPHVTETIYSELYKQHEKVSSVHQTRYAAVQVPYVFEPQAKLMTAIIGITAQVRKLKSENKLSLKTPLATLHIFAQSQELIDAIAQHDQLIRGITQAVQTVYTSKPSPFALSLSKGNEIKEVDGLWSAWVTTE
jgi:valyl-tRNA synthetase